MIPDILPQLKHVGFSLLLRFSSSSLTVMTVLREPITEFWCLSSPESCASVGITDPHACIPVCMQWGYAFCPFLCQDCRTETFPTSCRSPSGSITAWGIFMHDFLMFSREKFHATATKSYCFHRSLNNIINISEHLRAHGNQIGLSGKSVSERM